MGEPDQSLQETRKQLDLSPTISSEFHSVGGPSSGTEVAETIQEVTHQHESAANGADWRNSRAWMVAGGGVVAALLLAGLLFLIQMPTGILRVELNDPDVKVSVRGTEIVITNADKEPVKLSPGEHSLTVTRGDFGFDTDTLILKKNETVAVIVEFVEGELRASHDGKVIGSRWMGDRNKTAQIKTDNLQLISSELPNGWVIEPPVNLGPVVNSRHKDGSPALSADG